MPGSSRLAAIAWTSLVVLFLTTGGLSAQTENFVERRPVLQIFEPKMHGETMTQMGFDAQKPLLTIRSPRQVVLASDNRGVLLVLNEADTKAFYTLTNEFNNRPLIFRTPGGMARPITINGAVDDGRIGFKYPEAAPLADDLRRSLRLGEFELNLR